MKRLATIAVLFMWCVSIGTAQTNLSEKKLYTKNNSEKIHFGGRVGSVCSSAYYTNENKFNENVRFGWTVGGFVGIPMGIHFGIQPEISFLQKGFEGKGIMFGSKYFFKRSTSYIDIPLLLVYKPTPFINILAGPQYSYLVYQKDDFESTATSSSQEQQFKQDKIRKGILGIVSAFNLNLNHIVLGLRIGCDLQNSNTDGVSTASTYKNVWFQTSVGYAFFKKVDKI
jgi:hypothetical protein